MNEVSYLDILFKILALLVKLCQPVSSDQKNLFEKISQRFIRNYLFRLSGSLPSDKLKELDKSLIENLSDQKKIIENISNSLNTNITKDEQFTIALEELENIIKELLVEYKGIVSPKAWEVTQNQIITWLDNLQIPADNPAL